MVVEASQEPAQERVRRVPRGIPVFAILAVAILAFLVGGAGGSYQAKLADVQKNDNASFLPESAESTRAQHEATGFLQVENVPGFIVFVQDSGLTTADKERIARAREVISRIAGVDRPAMAPTQYSADGTAAALYVPLVAKENGVERTGPELSETEQEIVAAAKEAAGESLDAYPAGIGGLLVAFIDAFEGLDGKLLFAAVGVVVLILLFVYRSPVLWVFPLLADGLALGMASMVVYFLAREGIVTLNGQSQGILMVLVLGAGTDYALLLTARYREELHEYKDRFDAMIVAWRESAPAIVASAATVAIGLLCLTFSELKANQGLGPIAAIGIACTLLVMMTFLPVALALAGRWIFWPRIPHTDHESDIATHGFWGRIAQRVVGSRRPAWIATTLLLLVGVAGIGMLDTGGLTIAQGFTNRPEAVVGQEIYDAKFDRGVGNPAIIMTNADAADEVIAAASKVPGVQNKPGSVCVQVDLAKLLTVPQSAEPQCPPKEFQVQPINGRTLVNVTLTDGYDSPAALETVDRLRAAVHAVPNSNALVGGGSAVTVDIQDAAVRDRNLIIPIVLAVIFVVLALLLRALIAPLLLIATVVLSFFAALGVSGFFFDKVFNFAGGDQSFPLFAFVFLVALGIDYNIFLMTRVREETVAHGTRQGILRGLAVTGGVITSAGLVLAATFAVLGVMPIVFLAQIGFTVAFGVLLDTFLVRSVLVPALAADVGKLIWWPSKLARGKD